MSEEYACQGVYFGYFSKKIWNYQINVNFQVSLELLWFSHFPPVWSMGATWLRTIMFHMGTCSSEYFQSLFPILINLQKMHCYKPSGWLELAKQQINNFIFNHIFGQITCSFEIPLNRRLRKYEFKNRCSINFQFIMLRKQKNTRMHLSLSQETLPNLSQ